MIAASDNHFHVGPRWGECLRTHANIVAEVERRKPDLFLLGGDFYDAESTPDERSAAAEFHQRIANICPILHISGNHGRRRDLRILGKLNAKHPIIIEEGAHVHYIAGAAIAAFAWPERATIAAMLGKPSSAATTDAKARELIREMLDALGEELAAHPGPRILLGHFMIDGSSKGVGQPLIGAELAIRLGDLALARAHLVLAGHIHRAQHWMLGSTPVAYISAPFRTDYGDDPDVDKSMVYAENDDDGTVRWERISTQARKMHLLTGQYAHGALDVAVPADVAGSDIRVRYDVPEAEMAAGDIAARELRARLLAAGAADVKLDPVPSVIVRVRSPEVAAQTTVEGQLRARWHLRGEPPEKQARLLDRLAKLRTPA